MKNALLKLLAISSTIILLSCSVASKNFIEIKLDDMYPILNEEQYENMKSLTTEKEINSFLDDYWNNIQLTLSENELRSEYESRLEYANEHYPDLRGWGRSDRKRIYLIYGPPAYVEHKEFTKTQMSKSSYIQSMEIWYYMTPGKYNFPQSLVETNSKGEKKFIFVDKTGTGNYEVLYSTEDYEYYDLRILNDF